MNLFRLDPQLEQKMELAHREFAEAERFLAHEQTPCARARVDVAQYELDRLSRLIHRFRMELDHRTDHRADG